MATRRPHDDDEPRPKRKKRKQQKAGPPIVLFIVIGVCVAILLALGIFVLTQMGSRKDKEPPATAKGSETKGTSIRPGVGSVPANAPLYNGPNLLTNGSFEDGPEPDAGGPGFTPMEAGTNLIPGWNITRGSIDYIGPYWQHSDGRRSIDLNGNEPGAIAQTFATQVGKKYRLTFSMAGNNCGNDTTPKTVTVSAAGSQVEFSFDVTGHGYTEMGWQTKTWEFTATEAQTTLEFTSTTLETPACGPALDRVVVVEVG
jgi:choice-of-anchor C domain-containing protein